MPTPGEFLVSASNLLEDLVSLRRKLHQIPEFALHLPKTQQALIS
jgi:hippurate hydrolase